MSNKRRARNTVETVRLVSLCFGIATMARHTRIQPGQSARVPEKVQTGGGRRLRLLLWILAATTAVLIAQQVYRYTHKGTTKLHTQSARSGVEATLGEEGYLPVQFDDEGELDMGTLERMLDILYKRPKEMEGYETVDTDEGSYRFRKKAPQEAPGASAEPNDRNAVVTVSQPEEHAPVELGGEHADEAQTTLD